MAGESRGLALESGILQPQEADESPHAKLLERAENGVASDNLAVPQNHYSSSRRSSVSGIRSPRTGDPSSLKDKEKKAKNQEAKGALYKFVLVPERGSRTSSWLTVWEFFTSVLVIACAYIIPFSLALPTVATQFLRVFNCLLDVCFTIDIGVNFSLAYRNTEDSDAVWEKNPKKIALRYCGIPFSHKGQGGWFWMDALSVLPAWAQFVVSGPALNAFRFMRLLRMSRLTRLTRKIEEGQATTGVPFFISDILKFVFITTVVSHIAACIWVMIEGKVNTPLFLPPVTSGESWLSALRNAKGDCCDPDAENDPLCIYNLALYWAMMTLTTVGYGDITPQHSFEYTVCTLFMLVAGFVWAYIVGSVVSLLSQIDPDNALFKQRMDQLNALMDQRNLSPKLRDKLREYMVVAKGAAQVHTQQVLLEEQISSGLQREVVLQTPVTQTLIDKVYWVKHLEQDALLEIVRNLRSSVYGKEETIPVKDKMIIVREGLVAVKGRILGRNDVYGENEILLATDFLMSDAMPRTLSYVTMLSLTKQSLREVGEVYPAADKSLRAAQIRTALWRGFIYESIRQKKLRKSKSKIDDGAPRSPRGNRGSFVAAVSRTQQLESIARLDELREVETTLVQGQRDLVDQMAEVRSMLANHTEVISELVADMRSGGMQSNNLKKQTRK